MVFVASTGLALATAVTVLATTGFRFLETIFATGLRATVGVRRTTGFAVRGAAGFAAEDLVAAAAGLRATVLRTAGLRVVVGRVAKMGSSKKTMH